MPNGKIVLNKKLGRVLNPVPPKYKAGKLTAESQHLYYIRSGIIAISVADFGL
jgi:hypothetical protein